MTLQAAPSSRVANSTGRGHFLLALAVMAGILAALFWQSFLPGRALYATDTPLSFLNSQARRLPQGLTGEWADLNTLGYWDGSPPPNLTTALLLVLGPTGYARFEPPLSLLMLGLCAWYFFGQLGLAPLSRLLGSLAAMLNSTFFSAACWGVGNDVVAVAFNFLALALLVDKRARRRWLRLPLAGLAVGLGVSEGSDSGAILSLFVGAFVLWQASVEYGFQFHTLCRGIGKIAVVASLAGLVAAHAIFGLINTQIKGVGVIQAGHSANRTRWEWATQWSLPKAETLGLLVPGLFGYRMDAQQGAAYWGAMGRHAAWDEYFANGMKGPPPQAMLRYSGGGNYAGVLVLAVALWALLQCRRSQLSPFRPAERWYVWFWAGTAALSLLLAVGRFAPFYRLFFLLPYASTIRSPVKFLPVLEWSLVILFAYGVEGLWRIAQPTFVVPSREPSQPDLAHPPASTAPVAGVSQLIAFLKGRWAKASAFDRRWLKGSLAALELSLLGWVVYGLSRHSLETWLQLVDFNAAEAAAISSFSVRQVGWFILFLALVLGLVAMIILGCFGAGRRRLGGALLVLLLALDLGRANLPWIYYWDYSAKIASNPVLDFLRDKPYEHRVTTWLNPITPEVEILWQLYRLEWIQHHYPYYNIQTLDIFQLSRKPTDLAAFEQATEKNLARRWQLTNTRYLLGAYQQLQDINAAFDPVAHRFKSVLRFDIVPKPGLALATRCEDLRIQTNSNGRFAIIEFSGALPRAKLYSRWLVNTNDGAVLEQLANPSFDPADTVLVDVPLRLPTAPGARSEEGKVAFADYQPKRLVLEIEAPVSSVLLLNDRFDPNWKLSIDGRQEQLLRCNYIMRGAFLEPGSHRVEFQFQPPTAFLQLSLAVLAAGAVLGVVWATRCEPAQSGESTPPEH